MPVSRVVGLIGRATCWKRRRGFLQPLGSAETLHTHSGPRSFYLRSTLYKYTPPAISRTPRRERPSLRVRGGWRPDDMRGHLHVNPMCGNVCNILEPRRAGNRVLHPTANGHGFLEFRNQARRPQSNLLAEESVNSLRTKSGSNSMRSSRKRQPDRVGPGNGEGIMRASMSASPADLNAQGENPPKVPFPRCGLFGRIGSRS